jgi:hypothetical protein
MSELVTFLGGPAENALSNQIFCTAKGSSRLFINLYEPIWDNGESGTPVNDSNHMALYVYKLVTAYTGKVRYWEVLNEPDYTSTDKGWQNAQSSDNWWIRDPAPCELDNLFAPVQHYVRALRIAYEVIKSISPNDFVCIGGIGYESFLDAVLRNTDNPDQGRISGNYPLKGGAYFDCLSFHDYPMYGLREWKNSVWTSQRHSDKAIEVLLAGKSVKVDVLAKYGYNGTTYPEKRVITTETNLPHREFDSYIGSDISQRNYLVKAIVKGQAERIDQIHTYCLTDSKVPANSYQAMGFYQNLETVTPFQQIEFPSAVACRTTMQLLANYSYSKNLTSKLILSADIDGAAFIDKSGKQIYALWARTTLDLSEVSDKKYTFPTDLNVESAYQYDWDYTLTKKRQSISGSVVQLTGTPSFFEPVNQPLRVIVSNRHNSAEKFTVKADRHRISIHLKSNNGGFIRIFNSMGSLISSFDYPAQADTRPRELTVRRGVYIVSARSDGRLYSSKIIVN